MKRLAKVFASACLSLAFLAGVSFTMTGCAADSLSGPDIEAYATDGGGGGGTDSAGSDHNIDKAGGSGGGTDSAGSDHNID